MSPTHGTPASTTFEKRNDRPTLIDGLRRQSARKTQDCGATRGADLSAHCLICGAAAHDWRRLLGIGARIVASTPQTGRMVLRHPNACSRCGASDLVVAALSTAEAA